MIRLAIHRMITFLFIGGLFVPLVVLLLSEQSDISTIEKRRLAGLPKLEISYKSIKGYPKKFAAFLEDHFGFRNEIIGLHNYVYCKVLGISPSRAVVAGKSGWYFLNMNGAVSDYLGRIRYDNLTLHRMESLLEDRREWLNRKGIKYLFLPIPNKEMVYEEFLPDILRKHKGKSKYDQIVAFLEKSNYPDYIDGKRVLLAQKKAENIYFRTDSHWNALGAYAFYRELVYRLQLWFPWMKPLAEVDSLQWRSGASGDVAALMHVHGKVTESVPGMPVVLSCQPLATRRMKEIRNVGQYSHIPDHRLPVTTGCKSGKGKALVIHDSFGEGLKPFLNQHFKEIIYVHYMNFEVAKRLIEDEHPDIVLDLRVARNIEKALEPDPDLEQSLLRHTFKGLEEITSISSSEAQRRLVKIEGGDFPGGDGQNFSLGLNGAVVEKMALKIDITAAEDMDVRFCYAPAMNSNDKKSQKNRQCQLRRLKEGDNQIYLRVLDPDNNGIFWVVLEDKKEAGQYLINKITAKREK